MQERRCRFGLAWRIEVVRRRVARADRRPCSPTRCARHGSAGRTPTTRRESTSRVCPAPAGAAQLADALSADDEQQRILPARLPRRRLSAAKSGKQLAPPATSS